MRGSCDAPKAVKQELENLFCRCEQRLREPVGHPGRTLTSVPSPSPCLPFLEDTGILQQTSCLGEMSNLI